MDLDIQGIRTNATVHDEWLLHPTFMPVADTARAGGIMTRQARTLSSSLDSPTFSWLDKLADPIQKLTGQIFSSSPMATEVKDWLNGTPIRHRLHPAIVALPIGAWTMATIFDALESASSGQQANAYRAAADTSVGVGIVGAVASAASGLADWADLFGHERRVGTAHAVSNSTALLCYAASYALRKGDADSRAAAKSFASFGYLALMLGGSLGGDLVYNLGANVRFTLYPKAPNEFRDVLASNDLAEGKPVVVEVERVPVLLYRHQGEVMAVENWCTHVGGPLSEGTFDGNVVTCPWHGSKFCMANGAPLQGPASAPLRTFEVREEQGRIMVKPSYEGQDWPPPPTPPLSEPKYVVSG
jgi:nitrite reductase/ring-hydroxylating ferredoxin subunit/uncharacterized membrane protein